MAFLLLRLALFAAVGAVAILVIALLLALGTTHAVARTLSVYGLFRLFGWLALSALSPRMRGRRWSASLAAV